mmetsp:Transcript_38853/g.50867  ORF Transcript_38853/g.50867 Transcript_38853/m.50867 type:complete len:103 (+) Transcript_38853:470-778(+)
MQGGGSLIVAFMIDVLLLFGLLFHFRLFLAEAAKALFLALFTAFLGVVEDASEQEEQVDTHVADEADQEKDVCLKVEVAQVARREDADRVHEDDCGDLIEDI